MSAVLRLLRGRSGGVALEFALLAPVMLFTLMGLFDFARALSEDGRVANAALAGVHYGMQSAAHAGDYPGIIQAARADANDESLDVDPARSCSCPDGGAIACDGICGLGGKPIMHIRVEVRRDFRTMISYPFVENPIPLLGVAETRVE